LENKITVCIICKDKFEDYQKYLSDYKPIASEFIIVNSSSNKTDKTLDHDLGIPVIWLLDDSHNLQSLALSIKKAKGEWILILNAGEILLPDQMKQLQKLCQVQNPSAYYVTVEKTTDEEEMTAYEWLGNLGTYSIPAVQDICYVSCLEIRLFLKKQFLSFQSVQNRTIIPILAPDTSSSSISNIRIKHPKISHLMAMPKTAEEKNKEDLKRYYAKAEENIDVHEQFPFLVRNAIGYSLVKKKDLPSLKHGLEMGFGNLELLKFMVHHLIKEEAYLEAIEFADDIADKLGEHAELWRLKGTAYFYMLNFTEAEKCYLKALSFNNGDRSIWSNLAKISIILNQCDQAKRWLKELSDNGDTSSEFEFFNHFVNLKQEKAATLSALILCRDEAEYIGRAIDSVKAIVDEIVVVDSGSKDNTIDIALEKGATIVQTKWEDDFGKARNIGLQKVKSDYVLCLDADEYFETDTKMSLLVFKHILPTSQDIAIVMDIHTLTEGHSKNRLSLPPLGIDKRMVIFPKLPKVHYTGRIFERIDDTLNQHDIKYIYAKDIFISHKSSNMDVRKIRKSSALEKSFQETISIPTLIKGIDYWTDRGNIEQGFKWFKRVIEEIGGNNRYESIIYYFVKYFHQHQCLNIYSSFFKKLLSLCAPSYKVMTLCAEILYENRAYQDAIDILEKLTIDQDKYHDGMIAKQDFQNNVLNLAMANLNLNDFDRYKQTVNSLSMFEEMVDACYAVHFYHMLKQREIEHAISVLDSWIRERDLPIKKTLDNMVDLLKIISDIAEIMFQYGQEGTGKVLVEASEFLAVSIGVKE